MAGFEELHKFPLDARIGGCFPVLQVIHVAFKKRVFREQFDHAEGSAACSGDVHPAVFVAFYDVEDFGSTTDASNAFGKREEHAEFRFFLETVFHHLAVTRFENMQGHFSAGEKDDVQRKQRNAFRPHGSQTTMIPDVANDGDESWLRNSSIGLGVDKMAHFTKVTRCLHPWALSLPINQAFSSHLAARL